MVECVFRIILCDITLGYERICSKIQKQAAVPANQGINDLIQLIFLQNLADDDKGSDM